MAGKHIQKVCVEQLQKELGKGDIKTAKRGWDLFYRYLSCFIAVSKQVDNLTIELYGNGTPGGIKQDVALVLQKVEDISKDLEEMKKDAKEDRKHYGKRKSDLPTTTKEKDTFDKLIYWFIDKILPSIVIAFIILVANIVLLGAAVLNGWIKFIP